MDKHLSQIHRLIKLRQDSLSTAPKVWPHNMQLSTSASAMRRASTWKESPEKNRPRRPTHLIKNNAKQMKWWELLPGKSVTWLSLAEQKKKSTWTICHVQCNQTFKHTCKNPSSTCSCSFVSLLSHWLKCLLQFGGCIFHLTCRLIISPSLWLKPPMGAKAKPGFKSLSFP